MDDTIIPAWQKFESDLDALEATERDKLKRVEGTVELLKRTHSTLEAAGQERYLAKLPLSRISRRLLQAHSGLSDDRSTLERFSKAHIFLVRQMPFWRQLILDDHGSAQRPRRVRGWETLNQTRNELPHLSSRFVPDICPMARVKALSSLILSSPCVPSVVWCGTGAGRGSFS